MRSQGAREASAFPPAPSGSVGRTLLSVKLLPSPPQPGCTHQAKAVGNSQLIISSDSAACASVALSFRSSEAARNLLFACGGYAAERQQIPPFGRNDDTGTGLTSAPSQSPPQPAEQRSCIPRHSDAAHRRPIPSSSCPCHPRERRSNRRKRDRSWQRNP